MEVPDKVVLFISNLFKIRGHVYGGILYPGVNFA